jgi:hypothetical protein
MAVLNFAHREITTKIVYFGPAGAGCTTNVCRMWEALTETDGRRGRLHRFGAVGDSEQTCFFELRSVPDRVGEFGVRYRIYSMPGGVDDPTHREEVMRGVDAVVLVVDARPDGGPPNEEALLELEDLVSAAGLDLATLPVVVQVNHTDAPDARPMPEVTFALNPFGFPVIEAAAVSGRGLHETFAAITTLARERLLDNLRGDPAAVHLTAVHDDQPLDDDAVARAHRIALDADLPAPQTASNTGPRTPAPLHEVEVAFQPREFAGSYPVRVVDAAIDDGRVYIDVELKRMGDDGELQQLRVRLANRPTDAPAVPQAPSFSLVTEDSQPSVMGVTDHLPDKVDLTTLPTPADAPELPAVLYGIIGVAGGLLIGGLLGFLVFA